ncbi:MAG TPA: hypothetical protein VFV98_09495 [Vicinamibacterales bacterium]|nr:hypothetical protein [Vicinamibacterales bacterium]
MKIKNLHRTFVAIIGAAIASVTIVAAQQTAGPATAEKKDAPTVTFNGCLQPGSTADTFLLTAAKEKGDKSKGASKTALKVVPGSAKVKLGDRVLQAVEIKGTVADAPATGGSAETGEALKVLTATSVTWKADYCG